MRFLARLALVSAFALAAVAANADSVEFKAKLTGAAETPPNTTAGTGDVVAHYDTATKTLDWTVNYSGLTGPALMAHFHGPAPAGKAAGIQVPITGSVDSPIKGAATLTDAQAKDLMAGMWYFNIHTSAHKPGEIRGQLEKGM